MAGYLHSGRDFLVRGQKAIVGLRPSFPAHVRWGEQGAPVRFPPAFGYNTGSCETRPFPKQALHWLVPERPAHLVPARLRNLSLRQTARADPTGQSR
jgi:hypothetical protein